MNAVIFDMDGVIFDTERIWIECWSPVGKAHNIRDIEKVLRDECVGITAAAMKASLQKAYGADFPYDEYVKGSFEGCFPDTHNAVTGLYGGAFIMPGHVISNIIALLERKRP